MNVKIMVESGAEIPKELCENLNIEVIPMVVNDGTNEFFDCINIFPNDLYDGMRSGVVYKTSQVPLNTYLERFRPHAESGDTLILLSLSSGVSNTYQSAAMAANIMKEEFPDSDIIVVDTKAVALGFGLVAIETAKYVALGKSKSEILEYVDYLCNHIVHIFSVFNMEYLYRGGRVSRTQAFLGSALNIKPILHVDKEGKLMPLSKARGDKNFFSAMTKLIKERANDNDLSLTSVAISSGDSTVELRNKVQDFFVDEFNVKDFILTLIGPTMGAHTGPEMIALFYFDAPLYPNRPLDKISN